MKCFYNNDELACRPSNKKIYSIITNTNFLCNRELLVLDFLFFIEFSLTNRIYLHILTHILNRILIILILSNIVYFYIRYTYIMM